MSDTPNSNTIAWAGVLVASLNAGVAWCQWRAIERTNNLSRDSLTTSRDSVRAAETANRLAQDQIIASKEQAKEADQATRQGLDATQRQLRLAERGVALSERSQRSNESAARNKDRPWLAVLRIEKPGMAAGRPVDVRVRNYGILPAFHVRVTGRLPLVAGPRSTVPPETFAHILAELGRADISKWFSSRALVSPNADVTASLPPHPEVIAAAGEIQAGVKQLYALGSVYYDDPFGVSHRLTFCQLYLPKTPEADDDWIHCSRFNETT